MHSQLVVLEVTEPTTLVLEPWGDTTQLEAGQVVTVEAQGPVPGALCLRHEPGLVVVFGWSRAVVRVKEGDRQLWPVEGGWPYAPPAFPNEEDPLAGPKFLDLMFGE